jgi:hypothetical protein
MTDKLSIARSDEISLETTSADRVASFLKAVAGTAPIVGSMLAEVLAVTIPNQKQDRVIAFLKVLGDKIKYIEEDVLRAKVQSESFTNLLEDALHYAARSVTDEKREYLASLLKNNLTKTEVDDIGQKELLELLSSLNDAEIIILKFETLWRKEREEFEQKHGYVLAHRIMDDRDAYSRAALRDRYEEKLIKLGLLDKLEYVDERRYETSELGHLLLRYIDLED